MRASATRVYDALGWMEQALSIAPYLAGDDITAADIVALSNIQMLRRAAVRPEAIEMALGLENLDKRLPALGAWLSRMEKCGDMMLLIYRTGVADPGGQARAS